MKKIAPWLIVAFSSLAEAGYQKGNHVVSASFGGVIGANELSHVKGTGLGGGAAYRYYLADMFSVGADLALDDYGDHYSEANETDVDIRLFSTAMLGRLDFWPRNPVASYVSMGFGSTYVEQTFREPAGDRTETTGRASYFIAIGIEAPLRDKWMWGGELRSIDPLGISANALALKLSLSRRFGPSAPTLDKDVIE
jgi:opacity protein-like surface antigen